MKSTLNGRYFTAFAAVLIYLAGTLGTAYAKVRITERTKFYTVTGKTGKQLFRSIARRGPQGGHAIATAAYRHKFKNIKTAVRGRRCVVVSADLDVRITYTYPKWRNSRRASKKLQRNWKKFMARVVKHEETHGRYYRNYAKEIHKLMRGLKGRVSRGCKNFGKSSARAIARAERRHTRRHNRLDRRDGRVRSRIRRLQAALIRSK